MNTETHIGLYGKLPAYGDFIFRNLNPSFINPWDEWLQNFISGSQQQIGEDWLDVYLTSPVWRFVISSGVIDNMMWAGLMMPSVDRVGRYFPVSVVKPFVSSVNPVSFISDQREWYSELENICFEALEGRIDVDTAVSSMDQLSVLTAEHYQPTQDLLEMGPMLFGMDADDENNMGKLFPYLLNASLVNNLRSYSLWVTEGSNLVSPVFFSCQGLPPIGGIASMLDGLWQQRNWKIPYNLQQIQN